MKDVQKRANEKRELVAPNKNDVTTDLHSRLLQLLSVLRPVVKPSREEEKAVVPDLIADMIDHVVAEEEENQEGTPAEEAAPAKEAAPAEEAALAEEAAPAGEAAQPGQASEGQAGGERDKAKGRILRGDFMEYVRLVAVSPETNECHNK
jgi:hypothetical protein